MAKITFKASEDYSLFLGRYAEAVERGEILEKAVYAGGAIVADAIRANLDALPEGKFHHLRDGEMFKGIPASQKQDLADSFGLTPIQVDRDGCHNTKAGFDGYGRFKTQKYPQGVPNQMLARAVESGSSVREKTPFVRPAVSKTRKKAIQEMSKVIDEETKTMYRRK